MYKNEAFILGIDIALLGHFACPHHVRLHAMCPKMLRHLDI